MTIKVVNTGSPLSGFLSGVRVLDLSQYIPGPMATLFLADMGADVLKIEPPQGDEMRNLGPKDAKGRPTFYRALNAGKSVRRMNLKDPGDRAAFLELVAGADIVVEGFRPGVMQRLGIDYPVLSQVNPGVILCSISGYGIDVPYATRAGHDANYLALMGVAHRNGGQMPAFFDPPMADGAGSLFAAMTILGALHGRTRTGRGCAIDLALADTVMPLQMMQIAGFGASGTVLERGQYYLNGGAAYYQVYALNDGRFAVLGAVEPKFWANFCTLANRPDLIERHADPMPQTALQAEVATIFDSMSAEEAETRFGAADCCFSVVNDLGEALAHSHVRDRQLVRPSDSGDLQALFPVWIDGLPSDCRPDIAEINQDHATRWTARPLDHPDEPTHFEINLKTGNM